MTESRTDTALGLGERLRSARKARATTLEQASQALRIEVPVLRALEENRFDELGAPVFVRGHLRAYAKLLGLSEDTVLAAYRTAVPGSDVPPRVARERERPITSGPGAGSVVTLVLVVVALVGTFWLTREEPPAPMGELIEAPADAGPAFPPSRDVASGGQPAPEPAPGSDPATPAAEQSAAESSTGVSAAETPVAAASPAADAPAADGPPSGQRRLTLEFLETAWVEISDRSGRLLAGEQPAGARHELSGEPPFDIVLGNREGVRLSLDGVPVVYPGDVAGRRVARFRLPAPGAENGDG